MFPRRHKPTEWPIFNDLRRREHGSTLVKDCPARPLAIVIAQLALAIGMQLGRVSLVGLDCHLSEAGSGSIIGCDH